MTVPTQAPSTRVLQQAVTITLVVHGVGDHSTVNILGEAERGFRAMSGASAGETITTEISNMDYLLAGDASHVTLSALHFRMGGCSHIVLALVWSNTRDRLRTALLDRSADLTKRVKLFNNPPFLLLITGVRALKILWRVVAGPGLRSIRDSLLLPLSAKPGWWRLGTTLAAAVYLAAVTAWTAVAVVVPVSLTFVAPTVAAACCAPGEGLWRGVWRSLQFLWHKGEWLPLHFPFDDLIPWVDSWSHFAIVATLPLLIAPVLWSANILDLISDVSSYVADSVRRRNILVIVRDAIDTIQAANPQAQILVVGHSLGSVVVTQALVGLRPPRPLTLVTLGSPLPLIARVFPSIVQPVEALSQIYLGDGTINCWFHAYRDSDVIGRSLLRSPGKGYIECGLGDGPHWNYFSDARLWRKIAALVEADPTDDFAAYRCEMADEALDAHESRDLLGLRWMQALAPASLTITFAALCVLARRYLLVPDARGMLGISWPPLVTLFTISLAAALSTALSLSRLVFLYGRSGSHRQQLRNLRFWRVWLLLFSTTSATSAWAAFLLCLRTI